MTDKLTPNEALVSAAVLAMLHYETDDGGAFLHDNKRVLRAARWALDSTSEIEAALAQGREGEPARCDICGWTLAASREKGCVPGGCSYRPEQGSEEWHRITRRRKEVERDGRQADACLAKMAADNEALRIEIDRLRAELAALQSKLADAEKEVCRVQEHLEASRKLTVERRLERDTALARVKELEAWIRSEAVMSVRQLQEILDKAPQ